MTFSDPACVVKERMVTTFSGLLFQVSALHPQPSSPFPTPNATTLDLQFGYEGFL